MAEEIPLNSDDPLIPDMTNNGAVYDDPPIVDDAPVPGITDAPAPKSNLEALTEKLDGLQKPDEQKPAESETVAPVDETKAADEQPAPVGDETPEAKQARVEKLYTIPTGLKGEQRKQYVELVNHAKEVEHSLSAEREEVSSLKQWESDYKAIVDDSKATGEQMALAFEFIHLVNHGLWDDALSLIEAQRAAVAKQSGKAIPGVDLLDDFQDLRAQVDNLEITEERAHEIARYRRQEAAQQQASQRQSETQAQQQAARQVAERYAADKSEAVTGIDTWLKAQAGKDIDHPAKEAALNQYISANQEILQNLAPKLWLKHLQGVYSSMARAAPPPAPAPSKAPQPLRPRGGGAGLTKTTPSSNREALDRALGYQATA